MKHQLEPSTVDLKLTDLFFGQKDELVFVQKVFDVAFAFVFVVGKAIFSNHVTRGNALDIHPVLRDTYVELAFGLVFVYMNIEDLPCCISPSE